MAKRVAAIKFRLYNEERRRRQQQQHVRCLSDGKKTEKKDAKGHKSSLLLFFNPNVSRLWCLFKGNKRPASCNNKTMPDVLRPTFTILGRRWMVFCKLGLAPRGDRSITIMYCYQATACNIANQNIVAIRKAPYKKA